MDAVLKRISTVLASHHDQQGEAHVGWASFSLGSSAGYQVVWVVSSLRLFIAVVELHGGWILIVVVNIPSKPLDFLDKVGLKKPFL